ncbi:MAG: zinc ABC transporter substrate-binding protein [Chloroflexi bacterium]|nr:zinc ABC transporter substrate-binding protein [Chloroflexota bacterium]
MRRLALALALLAGTALGAGCDLLAPAAPRPAVETTAAQRVPPATAPAGAKPQQPAPTTAAPSAQPATPAAEATPAAPARATPAPAAQRQAATLSGPRLKVVATFSILGDLVRTVGGERLDLRVLVGPESDTHTFEPSPADVAALAEATLVFENGLGFEPWLDKLYASARSRARRVIVTVGLPSPIPATDGDHGGGDKPDRDQAEQSAHGEFDPHVWHDAQNAMHMVRAIRDALAQADPANAATYRANAERYLAELEALDAWIIQRVATLPAARRKLVTAHDTFAYFARRYGFAIVGTALGSFTTETADPSAARIVELVREIRAAGVPAIFAENVSNPRLMQRIAAEAGVALVPDLYTDALGKPNSPGDTYVKVIRSNVEKIVTALSR